MKNSQKNGWVRLHRKIEDNRLYFLEPFTKVQAWIDLFLNANHSDGLIDIRGNIISIKRGQIGWSELTMCKRWKWGKNRVRRFLKLLETEQQIVQQKDRFITTIITIINYDKFQEDDRTIQQTIQQTDSRRYINKNDKNDKNIYIESFESLIMDFWNSCGVAPPGVRNISATKKLLPKCQRMTEDIKEAVSAILKKENTVEDIKLAIKNYTNEIVNRDSTKGTYYLHRFSLYEFLKQKNGFTKYFNA